MMYQERLEDLSVHYWLKDKFSPYPFVSIEDGFPEKLLTLPTVSSEWDDIDSYQLELGNRQVVKERVWYIDIFAKNKSQRDEFAYKVFNDLDDGIPVYDYNEGFPEQGIAPTRLGCLQILDRKVRRVGIVPELTDELYFRAVVIFTARYDKL